MTSKPRRCLSRAKGRALTVNGHAAEGEMLLWRGGSCGATNGRTAASRRRAMNLTEVLCRSGPSDEGLLVAREALVSLQAEGQHRFGCQSPAIARGLNSKTSGALS
jgi:hypothetical protein